MDEGDFGLLSDEDDIGYEYTTAQAAVTKAFHDGLLRIRDGEGQTAKEYKVEYVACMSDGKMTFQKGDPDED